MSYLLKKQRSSKMQWGFKIDNLPLPALLPLSLAQDLPRDEMREEPSSARRQWRRQRQEKESLAVMLADELQIRGRNDWRFRDEPVYSRPTFPSGTSNLNSSHQNETSSSSGRCWILRRWDIQPHLLSTCTVYTVRLVHTDS